MKTLRDIPDLKDKKVLLRVDFDVPLRQDSRQAVIEESFRIKKQKETLDYLISHGARVVMVAHLHNDEASFSNLVPQLHMLLKYEFDFIKTPDLLGSSTSKLALLDNIRLFPGEKENDRDFARKLATAGSMELTEGPEGFDLYVNNDFAVCHRNHASVSAVTEYLPSYAGFVIEGEIAALQKGIDSSRDGKVIIIGGAKAETKIPVIKKFIDNSEVILVGGVAANDILKEKGQDIGSSVVDANSKELLIGLDLNDPRLIVPSDFVVFDNKMLDIGEKTIREYCGIISQAKTIIWNGSMGLFENPAFALGTNEVARAISQSNAYSIIGGGDTISAIDKIGLIGKFDPSISSGRVFISTGGGAMLEFLAGNELPGLKALNYYGK